jgi:hypothetical protein
MSELREISDQDRVIEIAIGVAAEGSHLEWQEMNEEFDPDGVAFFEAHADEVLAISDRLRSLVRENYDRLQAEAERERAGSGGRDRMNTAGEIRLSGTRWAQRLDEHQREQLLERMEKTYARLAGRAREDPRRSPESVLSAIDNYVIGILIAELHQATDVSLADISRVITGFPARQENL